MKNNYIIKVMPHYLPITKHQNVSIWNVAKVFIQNSIFAKNFLILGVNNQKISDYLENIIYIKPTIYKSNKSDSAINDPYIDTPISRKQYLDAVIDNIQQLKPKLIEVENDYRLAGNIAKATKIPVIFIPHVIIAKRNFLTRIIQYIRYIRPIKEIIFVSNAHKNHFKKYFFYSKKACTVIYNSYAHITPTRVNFSDKKNQIIFVGRGTVDKGYQEYILGLIPILQKFPDWRAIAHLSIENKNIDLQVENFLSQTNIQALLKNKQLEVFKNTPNKSIFKSFEESKIAVSATHSSFIEGFPLVGIEALAAKCSFITSRNPGFIELCKNNAHYLNSVIPQEITEKLTYLINNPTIMKDFAVSGYKHLLYNYNIKDLVKFYDNIRSKYIKQYNNQ